MDELKGVCLNGTSIADGDPITIAGGVMFLTQRRECPDLTWDSFRTNTKMGAIKAFSDLMNSEDENPTNGVTS